MIETLYKLIICHFIGDYVLQSNFIAKSKGTNIWHLLVHCFLYTVPFAILFKFNAYDIGLLLLSHITIDTLKAKYKSINYITDQILHFIIIIIIYMYPMI